MGNRYIDGMAYQLPHPFRLEAERELQMFDKTYKDKKSILRWISNDQVPPVELLDFWRSQHKRFNYEAAIQAMKREDKQAIRNYKRAMAEHSYSTEELAEMQSTFGNGTEVINVLTGKTTRL